jgi:hypothetical protein
MKGDPWTDESVPLTDEIVDAYLKEHENDPVDHAQTERMVRRLDERLAAERVTSRPEAPEK